MQKNPQAKKIASWIFIDFHAIMRPKVQLAPPHRNFINGLDNLEITYMLLLFQILCTDWLYFFRKNAYVEQKFIKYLRELTWFESNHLKIFWTMDALSSYFFFGIDAFLSIWILYAPDFHCYTLFSPISWHSKRRAPLISRQLLFHRPNSGQSLIKIFLKGGQVISGHSN